MPLAHLLEQIFPSLKFGHLIFLVLSCEGCLHILYICAVCLFSPRCGLLCYSFIGTLDVCLIILRFLDSECLPKGRILALGILDEVPEHSITVWMLNVL